MTTVAWAAFFLLLQAPAQQTPKASIDGFVLRAGTNEPIRGARVTLTRAVTPGTVINISPANAIPPVTTDSQGRFLATGLEAGTYTLTAQRNGFARQTYGERAIGRPGVPMNVLTGQAVKDIVFHLTPAGAVSGRITDASGEPLSSITVQLLQSRYDANGRRTFQQVGTGKTDDRGEYRIYWISAGRYYVSASPNRPQVTPSQPATNEVIDPGFAVTYYPGTTDPSSATAIELQPGEELNTIDLAMPMQQLYRIRGRVFDPKTGQFPRNVAILLLPRPPSVSFGTNFFLPTANAYNSANGTFDIRDIAPGSYLLQVESIALAGDSTPRQTAVMAVDVSNADVENLIVSFTPGITVSGHLSIEGGTAVSSLPNSDMLRVFLTPTVAQVILTGPQSVAPDGSFKIDNMQVGEYRINISPLPPGMYVKDARLGATDALAGVSITGPVSGSLEVLLSPNGGQLDGTIVDEDQKPQRGVQTVLIPDRLRDRRDLYRTAASDQNGHFVIRTVPPGDYKLFAWEDLEPFAYNDPDVLRRYEELGLAVNVAESAKLTVEVKLIPAGK